MSTMHYVAKEKGTAHQLALKYLNERNDNRSDILASRAIATITSGSYDEAAAQLYRKSLEFKSAGNQQQADAYLDAVRFFAVKQKIHTAQNNNQETLSEESLNNVMLRAVSRAQQRMENANLRSVYEATKEQAEAQLKAERETTQATRAAERKRIAERTPQQVALDEQLESRRAGIRAVIAKHSVDSSSPRETIVNIRNDISENRAAAFQIDPRIFAITVLERQIRIAESKERRPFSLVDTAHASTPPAAPRPTAPAAANASAPASLFTRAVKESFEEIIGKGGKGLMNPDRKDHEAIMQRVAVLVEQNTSTLSGTQPQRDALYARLASQYRNAANGQDKLVAGYALDVLMRAVEHTNAHKNGRELIAFNRQEYLLAAEQNLAYAENPAAWRAANPPSASNPQAGGASPAARARRGNNTPAGAAATGEAADADASTGGGAQSGAARSTRIRLYALRDGTPAPSAEEVPSLTDEDQVRALQERLGVTVDGKYGPRTHAAMLAAAQSQNKKPNEFDFTVAEAFEAFVAALAGATGTTPTTVAATDTPAVNTNTSTAGTPRDVVLQDTMPAAPAPAQDTAAAGDASKLAAIIVGLKDAQGRPLTGADLNVFTTAEFIKEAAIKFNIGNADADIATQQRGVAEAISSPVVLGLAVTETKKATIEKISANLKAAGVDQNKIDKFTSDIEVSSQGRITGASIRALELFTGRADANNTLDAITAAMLDSNTAVGKRAIPLIASAIKSGALSI